MACVVGITCDTAAKGRGRIMHESPRDYAAAVRRAGGTPLLLPHDIAGIPTYLSICHAIVLSGGDDPVTEPFGEPTHPAAKRMEPVRQAFEVELIRRLDQTAHPVLGVCFGMQLMALHHGGRLDQHLPDSHDAATVARHADADHVVSLVIDENRLLPARGTVHSFHHQAVRDAGAMRVVATCPDDGIIEAIDLADPRFYLGVQWHPERTADPAMGDALFARLVRSAR